MFYERYADGHQEGIQYVGAGWEVLRKQAVAELWFPPSGRGDMETKLIEVGAGQRQANSLS